MHYRLVALTAALFLLIAGASPVLALESTPLSSATAENSVETATGDDQAGVEHRFGSLSSGRFLRIVEDEYVDTPLGVVNYLYSSTCVIDDRMLFMAPGLEAIWRR